MTTRCEFCDTNVNPGDRLTFRHVEGWEQQRDQGGTNAIALRQPHERYACWSCIERQRKGIPVGQGSLL